MSTQISINTSASVAVASPKSVASPKLVNASPKSVTNLKLANASPKSPNANPKSPNANPKSSNANPKSPIANSKQVADAELGVKMLVFRIPIGSESGNAGNGANAGNAEIKIPSDFKTKGQNLMRLLNLARHAAKSSCDENTKKAAITKAIAARKDFQDKLVKFLVSSPNGTTPIARMSTREVPGNEILANREYQHNPAVGDSCLLMEMMLCANIVLPNSTALSLMRYRVAKLFGYEAEFANNQSAVADRLDRIMYFMFYHRGIVCNEHSRNVLNGYPHQLLELLQQIRTRLTTNGVFTLYQPDTVNALVDVLNLERLAYIEKHPSESIPHDPNVASDDKYELVGEFLSHLVNNGVQFTIKMSMNGVVEERDDPDYPILTGQFYANYMTKKANLQKIAKLLEVSFDEPLSETPAASASPSSAAIHWSKAAAKIKDTTGPFREAKPASPRRDVIDDAWIRNTIKFLSGLTIDNSDAVKSPAAASSASASPASASPAAASRRVATPTAFKVVATSPAASPAASPITSRTPSPRWVDINSDSDDDDDDDDDDDVLLNKGILASIAHAEAEAGK
jgi:ribosomal protein L12E/L44/L45/RPP1/RPP2